VSEELARHLRDARDATGHSLRELERLIHVSNSSLSRYFVGRATPPWQVVVALCQVAGRDPRPLRPIWERSRQGTRASTPLPVCRNDLPLDAPGFTGRSDELEAVVVAARRSRVVCIDGMGGVGKTALAVHVAHGLTGIYRDGQLFLDLHGYTPGQEPIASSEALRMLLGAFGVPSTRIPDGLDERASLWRSELAFRKAVVVLDNAVDADQVAPLLPGAGESLVLVTSRKRLVQLDGASTLSLDVLSDDQAAELFRTALADPRADHDGVAEVVRACGYLPLALRVAAARMRHRPAWTLETLLHRLERGEVDIDAVLAMSMEQLDPAQRRMFGLLAHVPNTDIGEEAAVALAGLPHDNAVALLDDLVDAHLLSETQPGRFRQHDLLRTYARGLGDIDSPSGTVAEAVGRLCDHYLARAAAAVATAYPELDLLRRPAPAIESTTAFAGAEQALAWLDIERDNLLGIGAFMADRGMADPTSRLATTLYPYLDSHALHSEALALATYALDVSRAHGDAQDEARALLDVVTMRWRQGRYAGAEERCLRALEVTRGHGDRYGEARALNGLGNVSLVEGDLGRARELFEASLAIFRQVHDRLYEAVVLGNHGQLHTRLGEFDTARRQHNEALAIHEASGSFGGQATALANLGVLLTASGEHNEAATHLREALARYRDLGYASGEAGVLNCLGELDLAAGRPEQAMIDHEAAVAIAQEIGDEFERERGCAGQAAAAMVRGRDA
jgi:tetratricopeptide (TPR) repeat protein